MISLCFVAIFLVVFHFEAGALQYDPEVSEDELTAEQRVQLGRVFGPYRKAAGARPPAVENEMLESAILFAAAHTRPLFPSIALGVAIAMKGRRLNAPKTVVGYFPRPPQTRTPALSRLEWLIRRYYKRKRNEKIMLRRGLCAEEFSAYCIRILLPVDDSPNEIVYGETLTELDIRTYDLGLKLLGPGYKWTIHRNFDTFILDTTRKDHPICAVQGKDLTKSLRDDLAEFRAKIMHVVSDFHNVGDRVDVVLSARPSTCSLPHSYIDECVVLYAQIKYVTRSHAERRPAWPPYKCFVDEEERMAAQNELQIQYM